MRIVYKHNLMTGYNQVYLPPESKILHIAEQHGQVMMWVEQPAYQSAPSMVHEFNVYATGQQIINDNEYHIGSVLMSSGLVWHVYAK